LASVSFIQTAYDYIRKQIMLGEFMPGSLLSENELADALQMSRTPVRSAISQLEHEGLVITLKNRGILVKELSMKESLDMIDIIYTFQLYALDFIESQGEIPNLQTLKGYLDNQLEATSEGVYYRYVENTLQFMQCFIAVTNNQEMIKIAGSYINKLILYSTINYKITPHAPHYSGNQVNQGIFDALVANDYSQIRTVLKEAHNYNRGRLLRVGKL